MTQALTRLCCLQWCHARCSGVDDDQYLEFQRIPCFEWVCSRCLLQSLPYADCSQLSSVLLVGEPDYNLFDISLSLSHAFPSRSSCLQIALLNARSLLSVSYEVNNLVLSGGFDILGICETWLDSSINDSDVCPSGLLLVRNDRNRRGGGVAFLVSDRVPRPDLCEGKI